MTIEKDIEAALQAPMTQEQRTLADARVQHAIALQPARRRRLPFRRSLLLVAAGLIVLPSLFVVGASILSTEAPFGLADADEFAAELEAAKADVPLPAGRTWPAFLTVKPDVSYSKGGGRTDVEGVAICIWLDEWLDARSAADATREAAAAATIASVPSWPSWTSPFWTESYTGHLQPLIDAVADGDEGPVKGEMKTNCEFAAE